MPRKLGDLPREIVALIGASMDKSDLARFSQTCWDVKILMDPSLFRTLTWTSRSERTSAVEFAAENQSELIRELVYTYISDSRALPFGRTTSDQTTFTSSLNLLARVTQLGLPHLRGLEVRFDNQVLRETPKHSTFVKNELMFTYQTQWMAGYFDVWTTIANAPGLTTLSLSDMPPTPPPNSPAVLNFFEHLTTLNLSLFGMLALSKDHTWAVGTSTRADYTAGVSRLDISIFSHLRRLKNLKLSASESSRLGVDFNIPFPIEESSLPDLETLQLQWIIVSEKLAQFIVAHKTTLRSVALVNCAARHEQLWWMEEERQYFGGAKKSIHWAAFFDLIGSTDSVLSSVVVTPTSAPLSEDEDNVGSLQSMIGWRDSMANGDYMFQEPSTVLKDAVSKATQAHVSRRFFSYVDIQLENPTFWFAARRTNCERFLQGDDDYAWGRLQQRVQENESRESRAKWLESCARLQENAKQQIAQSRSGSSGHSMEESYELNAKAQTFDNASSGSGVPQAHAVARLPSLSLENLLSHAPVGNAGPSTDWSPSSPSPAADSANTADLSKQGMIDHCSQGRAVDALAPLEHRTGATLAEASGAKVLVEEDSSTAKEIENLCEPVLVASNTMAREVSEADDTKDQEVGHEARIADDPEGNRIDKGKGRATYEPAGQRKNEPIHDHDAAGRAGNGQTQAVTDGITFEARPEHSQADEARDFVAKEGERGNVHQDEDDELYESASGD